MMFVNVLVIMSVILAVRAFSCTNDDRSSNQHWDLAVLPLGNSGVGKSFTGDILVGEEVFEHKYQDSSVTRLCEKEFTHLKDKRAVVYNVPGLVEIDHSFISQNKAEIDKSFLDSQNQVILFILSAGDGGRIRGDDVATYMSLNDAYHFNHKSVLFMMNQLAPMSKDAAILYEAGAVRLLRKYLHWPENEPLEVVLAPDMSGKKKARLWESEEGFFFRDTLAQKLVDRTPHTHRQVTPIEINSDKLANAENELNVLKASLKILNDENKAKLAEIERIARENSAANEKRQRDLREQIVAEQARNRGGGGKKGGGLNINLGLFRIRIKLW